MLALHQRPRPGRPVLLVQHHRLDDVELPGLRAGGRAPRSCCSTATRATPTSARCGGWPNEAGRHLLRHVRAVPAGLPQGRLVPRDIADLSRLRGLGSTGAPLAARGLRLGLRGGRRHPAARSRCPAAPTCAPASSAASPLLPVYAGEIACRALGARVEAYDPTGHPVIGELGELVDHRADAVHAGRLLGRPRRQPLPRGLLRRLPRRVAARRLDHHYRPGYLRHHRPLRRHPQPGRRPPRYRRVLLGGRGPAGGRSTRSWCTWRTPQGGAGELLLFVVLADGTGRSTTRSAPGSPASCVRPCRPRHVPDEIHQVARGTPDAVGQETRGTREADPDRYPGRRRRGPGARWPTRSRCIAFEELAAAPRPLEASGRPARRPARASRRAGSRWAHSTTVRARTASGASSQSSGSGWPVDVDQHPRRPGRPAGPRPARRDWCRRPGRALVRARTRGEVVPVPAYLDRRSQGCRPAALVGTAGPAGQRRARTARRSAPSPPSAVHEGDGGRPGPASGEVGHRRARPTSSRAGRRRSASAGGSSTAATVARAEAEAVDEQVRRLRHPVVEGRPGQFGALAGGVVVVGEQRAGRIDLRQLSGRAVTTARGTCGSHGALTITSYSAGRRARSRTVATGTGRREASRCGHATSVAGVWRAVGRSSRR